MKIKFSPSNRSEPFYGSVSGDLLTVNGETLDFSLLQEGGELPPTAINTDWLVGGVSRVDGEVCVTIICPHGANAPYGTRFPPDVYIVVEGDIPFPTYDVAPVEEPFIISDTPEE